MGSSGSGRFGNYRIGNGQTVGGANNVSGGAGGGLGGGGIEIDCPTVIENIRLEDVATSEYFLRHQSLPNPGEPVELNSIPHNGRLVVTNTLTKEVLGNLPTQYNYLINCIKNVRYDGTIIASGMRPIPFVVVTLHA